MSSTETVSHPGVIINVDDQYVAVRISSAAACGSCKVKGSCGMAEMEDKIVDVPKQEGAAYRKGDLVTIYMQQSLGNYAVFLGYVLPFIVVLIALIVMLQMGYSEGFSGLISLGILIPYYFVLFLTRDKLKKTFRFYIK